MSIPAAAFIIARITDVRGSSPREKGASMLIARQDILGSIGGGQLENRVIQDARHRLLEPICDEQASDDELSRDFTLGPPMNQCCGGRIRISYRYCTDPEQWQHPDAAQARQIQVILFGAGHVGKALAAILATQPCHLHWVDSRAEQFPAVIPANARQYIAPNPATLVNELPANAYILVMTHDHRLDLAICDTVLHRNRFRFLGLIGSQTKRGRFRKQLYDNGHPSALIDRLNCPIGVPHIRSKHPAHIALAVATQLLALQEQEDA